MRDNGTETQQRRKRNAGIASLAAPSAHERTARRHLFCRSFGALKLAGTVFVHPRENLRSQDGFLLLSALAPYLRLHALFSASYCLSRNPTAVAHDARCVFAAEVCRLSAGADASSQCSSRAQWATVSSA